MTIPTIAERLAKASRTPWQFAPQEGSRGHCFLAQVFDSSGNAVADIEPADIEADATVIADFIAHAPADIALLLSAHAQLSKRVEELEAALATAEADRKKAVEGERERAAKIAEGYEAQCCGQPGGTPSEPICCGCPIQIREASEIASAIRSQP